MVVSLAHCPDSFWLLDRNLNGSTSKFRVEVVLGRPTGTQIRNWKVEDGEVDSIPTVSRTFPRDPFPFRPYFTGRVTCFRPKEENALTHESEPP